MRVTRPLSTALVLLFAAAPVARATTSATFNFQWTDRLGATHPLVSNYVEVWDQGSGPGGTDTFIGSDYTTPGGQLNFGTTFTRPDGGPLNLYVNLRADVKNVGRISAVGAGSPYSIRL